MLLKMLTLTGEFLLVLQVIFSFLFFFQDLCVLLNNNYLKEELDTAC